MTPIEIIALILIIVSGIKIIVILINPNAWMNFAKKLFANASLVRIVLLILAGVVLYYLLQELTIIQILAAATLIVLLIGIGLAKDFNTLIKLYNNQNSGKLLKDNWLYTLIWIVLLAWGAKELFM